MTSETGRARSVRSLALASALLGTGCASFVEVPVETPLQSKLDVTSFRRGLIAGFVTDVGEAGVELGAQTSRLVQNPLRSNSRLQGLEPARPPHQKELD